MPLASADRIAFSGQIVGAAAQIKAIAQAQAQLQVAINQLQALDTANMNLFTPSNLLINSYQSELSDLDGNGRTVIVEQDIQDAANKKFQNHFFPNDTSTTVPSISSLHNVWPYVTPYALGFGIGKSYSEAYTTVTKEGDDISAITTLIASTSVYTDQELTTGDALSSGSCSLPQYTDQASCLAHSGTWTPGTLGPSSEIAAIKTNMVNAVNALKTFLTAEVALIPTNDPANQTNNQAAINNINNVTIPALNTWLAYPDFESTGAGPSKLHSTQMGALSTALSNRTTFIATRITQLNAILGTITQDITNGNVTGSGLYLTRFNYLVLRLNLLGGSLSQLAASKAASNAQTSISANVSSTAATYANILPTTLLAAAGNGTAAVSVVDASKYSVGDTVFVVADGQPELQRAIKSIAGLLITLNDVIPAKYTTDINVRLYKDLS